MSGDSDSGPSRHAAPPDGDPDSGKQIVDLPLFSELDPEPDATDAPVDTPETPTTQEVADPEPPPRATGLPIEGPATLTNRLGAALLDLAVMAATAVALLAGAALLGARPTLADWPAFVLPWIAFSFLYHVIPLAFWGRTPGMASMGLTARHLHGGGLSFPQAIARWLATLVTTALVGLPGLLALTGRSASDWASGSITIWRGLQPDRP